MRYWALLLFIAIFAVADLAPSFVSAQEVIELAQAKKRRTLMDLLFGEPEAPMQMPAPEPTPQAPAPQSTTPKTAPKAAPKAAPKPELPPPVPEIEKAAGATRLAVFGDSLAVDLSKALDRFYAEDPNLAVINFGVGSSGLVRDDYFNWPATVAEQISTDSFDVAVVMMGINDRQTVEAPDGSFKALTDGWSTEYSKRLTSFVDQFRAAGKPVIWVGLPPMSKGEYSTAMSQISALQRMASFSGGAEYLDIYEKFLGEDGKYSSYGPDLSGQSVKMRKDDGIHFSSAGADKLAFYVSQSLKAFYRGGGLSIEVADPLNGTDAQSMVRPPFQGLGQIRLLEVAGAVTTLSNTPPRAGDLLSAATVPATAGAFDLEQLMAAPVGRADAFGVGLEPAEPVAETPAP